MKKEAVKLAPLLLPNLSMGASIVRSLRLVTRLPLFTHLMIYNPDFFLHDFVEVGADAILVHWEGNNNLSCTVQDIKALGKRAGVAIFNDTESVAAAMKRLFGSIRQGIT